MGRGAEGSGKSSAQAVPGSGVLGLHLQRRETHCVFQVSPVPALPKPSLPIPRVFLELLRLEKSPKIIKSSYSLIITMITTNPSPQVPHPRVF